MDHRRSSDASVPPDDDAPTIPRRPFESMFPPLSLPNSTTRGVPAPQLQRQAAYFFPGPFVPMNMAQLPPEAFYSAALPVTFSNATRNQPREQTRRGDTVIDILNRASTIVDTGLPSSSAGPQDSILPENTGFLRRVSSMVDHQEPEGIMFGSQQSSVPLLPPPVGQSDAEDPMLATMMVLPEPTPIASNPNNLEIVDQISIADFDVWAREDNRLVSTVIDVLSSRGRQSSPASSSRQARESPPPSAPLKEREADSKPPARRKRKRQEQQAIEEPSPAKIGQDTKLEPARAAAVSQPSQPAWRIIDEEEIKELERIATKGEGEGGESEEERGDNESEGNEFQGKQGKKGSKSANQQRFRSYQRNLWLRRFREFIEFRNQHGHCLVPNIYPENPYLAQWVKRQRYQCRLKYKGKHSTVSDAREKALDQLGFVWDSHSATWMERWNELAEFYRKKGHSNVPTEYPENRHLSIW